MMRGAALPIALLAAAVALVLSYADPRTARRGAALFLVIAVLLSSAPLPALSDDVVFLGCWLSLFITAGLSHLKASAMAPIALAAAANAGLWAGLAPHVGGGVVKLYMGAPAILALAPGRWLVRRKASIVLRVAASWLMAIAGLEALLPLVSTPGYRPDHME
jgi:hypothetical protein